jgi:hypothetical protein
MIYNRTILIKNFTGDYIKHNGDSGVEIGLVGKRVQVASPTWSEIRTVFE